jgi:epoxyqueuosine reductase
MHTLPLSSALRALGWDEVRVAGIAGEARPGEALEAWLEKGYHADMAWLARTADKRRDPELVLPGARSLVMLGASLENRKIGKSGNRETGKAETRAVIARYARYQDYHDTLMEAALAAGRVLERRCGLGPEDWRAYVDTGPVLERSWAALAGMGFIGKNAMLVSRTHGNWLMLACLVTRAELEPDKPERSRCGTCTRCLSACPTGAIVAPGVVDSRRCISWLTIENKGPIPEEHRRAIGDRVFGCDICAEVCPWNRFAGDSRALQAGLLVPQAGLESLGLEDFLAMRQEEFSRSFKGSPIKRLKLGRLLRNACVVAGNALREASENRKIAKSQIRETVSGARLAGLVAALLEYPDETVRECARWALAQSR